MPLSDQAQQTATTILNQLGGRRFTAMTGAKNFVFCDKTNSLLFRLPSRFATNGINAVRVELTPMDVYEVTFTKVWGTKLTEVAKVENVYCDMLQKVFTENTGLNTSL